jgi:hypothetical protein
MNPPDAADCPECGAPLEAGAQECWLCALKLERPIGQAEERVEATTAPSAGRALTPPSHEEPPAISPSPAANLCPKCGAAFVLGARYCSACGQDLGRSTSVAGEAARRPTGVQSIEPVGRADSAQTLNVISTLILIATLAAVVAGAFSLGRGLGIVLVVVTAPAILFAALAGARRQRAERAPTKQDTILNVAESAAVFGLVAVAIAAVAAIATVAAMASAFSNCLKML